MRTQQALARRRDAVRRYRERHPERVKVQRRSTYLARKRRGMELLGGCYCAACGCDEIDFLEINHINGGGCVEIREQGNRMIDNVLSGKRSPVGLNVLCRVCNALDYLERKAPEASGQFVVRWEKFTERKAERVDA